MIYFTSDHHLDHSNIIKYCNRPFKDVKEMNECIIDNHNSLVTNKDTVYFLGDFCFNQSSFDYYMKSLNGQKHFIIGNHDPKNIQKMGYLFNSISQIKQINVENQAIVLCHFAMREWNKKFHGSWHLYGHSHGTILSCERSLDVGVDCWGFKPVSFEQIKKVI